MSALLTGTRPGQYAARPGAFPVGLGGWGHRVSGI
jgi:hypothetical protein